MSFSRYLTASFSRYLTANESTGVDLESESWKTEKHHARLFRNYNKTNKKINQLVVWSRYKLELRNGTIREEAGHSWVHGCRQKKRVRRGKSRVFKFNAVKMPIISAVNTCCSVRKHVYAELVGFQIQWPSHIFRHSMISVQNGICEDEESCW